MKMRNIALFISFLCCLSFFYVGIVYGESQSCINTRSVGYITQDDAIKYQKPFIDGSITFINGEVKVWTNEIDIVTSPIIDENGNRIEIGKLARMTAIEAVEALESAKKAWNKGQGTWTQMKLSERIKIIENIINELKLKRTDIVNVLTWEICKSSTDAELEFDRTIEFIEGTINIFKEMDRNPYYSLKTVRGYIARIRRTAIGIMLCLGPFNYPFNETYATLIPALLLGNIVIMKIPSIGGLSHILTADIYAKYLPPGTLNFITGSGRVTMGPLM